jgi:hypothetical protein
MPYFVAMRILTQKGGDDKKKEWISDISQSDAAQTGPIQENTLALRFQTSASSSR